MNWIIDILLVIILGFVLGAWLLCDALERNIKDKYFIHRGKLYKVMEVIDERQI